MYFYTTITKDYFLCNWIHNKK